jgi:transglutaminase-like putative cysteine protease
MVKEKGSIERNAIDGITLVFFAILLLLPGLSLRSADWTDNLSIVTSLGTLGTLAGVALTYSTFSGRTAAFFNAVYWLFAIGWQLGNKLDPALIWRDRIIFLARRFGIFIGTLFQGEENQDPLIFVFIMGSLLWFMGSYGVWSLFRKRGFWIAVIPPGIVLVANQIIYLGSAKLDGYLVFYVFMILLIASRLEFWRRNIVWRKLRAQIAPNTFFVITRAGVILAFLLIIVAWGAPAFARSEGVSELWDIIANPFTDVRDKVSDAFGGLRGSVGVSFDIYGDNLNLQAGTEPADILIMQIATNHRLQQGGRFYWYQRAYNQYNSGNWTMTIGEKIDFDPEQGDLPLQPYLSRQIIEVEVSPKVASMHGLYIASQPLWSSRNGEVDVYRLPNGSLDVLRITTDGVVRNGESYQARSSVAVPAASDLREASQQYPDWATENYLLVPPSITQRTRDLAFSITEGVDNPFEQAVLVTQWLRNNIEYQRVTIPPPEGAEQLDWFLFDYNVGFCNWYASAEVILLRTLGIPARIAVGYAHGSFNSSEGVYEVRAEDAHAWPEVFFPGYGWVEFEPTGNQSVLNRPEDREPTEGDFIPGPNQAPELDEADILPEDIELADPADQVGFGLLGQIDLGSVVLWFVLILLAMVAIVLFWFWLDPVSRVTTLGRVVGGMKRVGIQPPQVWQQVYHFDLSPAGKLYSRWSVWLRRLGLSLNLFQTPNERAEAFGSAFPLVATLGWKIVDTYVGERFGGESVEKDELKETWGEIRPFLWIEWLRKKVGLKSMAKPPIKSNVPQSSL